MPWEIISLHDKEALIEDSSKLYRKDPEVFQNKINSLWDSSIHKYRGLRMAELSCAYKHFLALYMVSKYCPNYGMILEDDAVFAPDFADRFRKYMNDTPEDWDAIFLGEGCGTSYQQDRMVRGQQVGDNCFNVGHPSTNCAEAYLIKPDICKKILDTCFPFHLAYDWELAYQFYKHDARVYWWLPSIVSQGSKNGTFQTSLGNI